MKKTAAFKKKLGDKSKHAGKTKSKCKASDLKIKEGEEVFQPKAGKRINFKASQKNKISKPKVKRQKEELDAKKEREAKKVAELKQKKEKKAAEQKAKKAEEAAQLKTNNLEDAAQLKAKKQKKAAEQKIQKQKEADRVNPKEEEEAAKPDAEKSKQAGELNTKKSKKPELKNKGQVVKPLQSWSCQPNHKALSSYHFITTEKIRSGGSSQKIRKDDEPADNLRAAMREFYQKHCPVRSIFH